MDRGELAKRWEKIEGSLREARAEIPLPHDMRPSGERQKRSFYLGDTPEELSHDFEEYLSENELELAWDALAALARLTKANTSCWYLLAMAAVWMNLTNKAVDATDEAGKAPEGGTILHAPLNRFEKLED